MQIQILIAALLAFLIFTYKWTFGIDEQISACISDKGTCSILPFTVLTVTPLMFVVIALALTGLVFFALDKVLIQTIMKPIHEEGDWGNWKFYKAKFSNPNDEIMSLVWALMGKKYIWIYLTITYAVTIIVGVMVLWAYNAWIKFSESTVASKHTQMVMKDVVHYTYMFYLVSFACFICFHTVLMFLYG